ncbi:predicted protein [Histoplasma mississippiense (nom. inval.)]|uniref:predicted protein n=1 Tax=Ajellomyces capsulatus (strain NAm1 / WU24) TaxID=2059318 RepID=UPI000157D630|nr:predicted protein [Histoplasma mississippiense (nom. inval.)]EDN06537.1 predicted protein [Histoplasma mississippiense (nom. inval.)]
MTDQKPACWRISWLRNRRWESRTTGDEDVIHGDLKGLGAEAAGVAAYSVYAGPVARGGKVINADAALRLSLARFVTVVDIRRGYYNTRCGCGRVEEAVERKTEPSALLQHPVS